MTRILIAGFKHETNTFSRLPADMAAFEAETLRVGDDRTHGARNVDCEYAAFIYFCEDNGWDFYFPVNASCTPCGPVTKDVYELVRDQILGAIDQQGPFDAALLGLHGATVCEHTDDGEGELLEAIREKVGMEMPIAVTLDLHANVSDRMAELANIIIPCKTFPHVDMYDTGLDAAKLIKRTLDGEINPVVTVRRGAMLDAADHGRTTSPGPMLDAQESAAQLLEKPGVIAASICSGFPWADIEYAGASVQIISDGPGAHYGQYAEDIVEEIWQKRHIFTVNPVSVESAVARIQEIGKTDRPVVLGYLSDQPGAGGYSDSTWLLKGMFEAGISDAAYAFMVDPECAEICAEKGIGAEVELEIGGNIDPASSPPLTIRGVVTAVTDGRYKLTGPMGTGATMRLGTTACVYVDGIDVILVSHRSQVFDQEAFRHVGIEPELKQVLVVQSQHHFRAAYGPIAEEIIIVDDGRGLVTRNFGVREYVNVRRPIYPLDLD